MVLRLLGFSVLLACARPAEEYRCEASSQCLRQGTGGFCEATGYCSFLDDGCATGRRYDELAGTGLEGDCVPLPRCGDGIVRSVVEECDDGNDDDADGCTHACVACDDQADARFAWADNGHCYTRHEVLTDWFTAQDTCLHLGAHLTAHETQEENAAVAAALGGTEAAWFGLDDDTLWVTGAAVQYTNWASGCPGGGMDFVLHPDGTWCDASAMAPHVCEHEPRWLVRPEDGHAYTVLPETTTRAVGAAQCAALGAHLADIETSEEQVFVNPLVLYGSWLGLSDEAEDGTFVWSSGDPPGYTNWGYDEPTGGTVENCVYMYLAGDWRDVPCDSAYYPLCEREL